MYPPRCFAPVLFTRISLGARATGAAIVLLFLAGAPRLSALNEIVFEDIFGRRLSEFGMVLVDWEGQIANPAIKVFVRPPSDATFPATAVVSATEPRLYFEMPSTASAAGPRKTLFFPNASPVPLVVSIFPDRDGLDEDYPLSVTFSSGSATPRTQTLNVHVIDQDQPQRGSDFAIKVEYARDQTGFFSDPAKRAIVEQVAEDWAYFFSSMNLDQVPAGAERTFIWNPDGFLTGNFITNLAPYRGFLLYAYGISAAVPPYRSGGEPSASGGFQSSRGAPLALRRSGGMEIETKGNFNTLGWFLSSSESDWWQATNLGSVANDLDSITHHEMGHSLVFHPSHTRFGAFKAAGAVNDPAVVAYHGSAPVIDITDHLPGSVDRLSGKGAFGYEYFGSMPVRRWMITKLDMLVAQAIGYTLRETSAFVPLAITTSALPSGIVNTAYSQAVNARGGIPFYKWSIKSGALPPGLSLNSFSGIISGQPTALGTFSFTVEVAEYDPQPAPVSVPLAIRITSAADGNPGRLINLSVLAPITTAGDSFSLGYVVSGASAGNAKPLVIRAAGPSLGALGYPGVLVDPKLELFVGSTKAGENDDWGGSAATAAAMAAVGAFPYTSPGSRDAAVAANVSSRDNSVKISAGSGAVNGTGAVIAEVYDATPAASFNAGTTPRLINFSVLKNVGASVTLGFVIGGTTNKTVLIRAVGPTLGVAPFNVGGAMPDPKVELYDASGNLLATSDNWAGTAALSAAFGATGAFVLPADSKDAALLATLAPGNYSVVVTPAAGTATGTALLEVYDVP